MSTSSRVQHGKPVSRRAQRRLAAERAARRGRLMLLGGMAAVLVVAVIAVAFIAMRGEPGDGDTGPALSIPATSLPNVPVNGRTIGNADAPVTVVEYGDYQCPGCGYFASEYEHRLLADYVAAGLVRFEYRDFAFIGDESAGAAEAAFCALDQGMFWPYHQTLFANQVGENVGGFTASRLRAAAEQLGLDEAQFARCLDDEAHRAEVDAMRDEARALGVTGTPSFVVNGTLIEYRGYDSLVAAIDAELATAR